MNAEIKIKIGNKEYSLDEAMEIYNFINKIFQSTGDKEKEYIPYPVPYPEQPSMPADPWYIDYPIITSIFSCDSGEIN